MAMPARLVGRGDVAVAQVAARRDAVGKARVDAGRGSLRFGLGVWVRVRVGVGVGAGVGVRVRVRVRVRDRVRARDRVWARLLEWRCRCAPTW